MPSIASALHPTRWLCSLAALFALACSGGGGDDRTLVSIAVGPATTSVAKGLTLQLTVTGTWSDGSTSDATSRARWTVSDPAIAAVNPSGLLSAVAVGTVLVEADVEGHTAAAHVEVQPAIAVSLDVEPATASLPKGLSQRFTAAALRFSDGTTAPVPGPVTWTTSQPTVATVDADGLASSTAQGQTAVVASAGGVSGQATLTVGPPAVVTLTVFPSVARAVRGLPLQFRAAATMTDGTTEDRTWSATWTSSDEAIATVDGGSGVGASAGTAILTATADGAAASATLEVTGARVAFVTSASGTGDLSSWPAAGGRTGLAAGDAVCQATAAAAGLPGTFRAWLSDEFDDAYCRVHGRFGKRAANCGMEALPDAAGPWVRTDAYPFAPGAARMIAGEVYAPLRYDERGRPLPAQAFIRTATGLDGAVDQTIAAVVACANWSSADPGTNVWGGLEDGTSGSWTWVSYTDCGNPAPIACFEVGDGIGPALPALDAGKKVFLTSMTGKGDLGKWPGTGGALGIAAGDAICRSSAAAAGLANAARFKAWLSDNLVNAIDRITSDGPWVRLDGARVAADRAELASGRLFSSIALTELGEYRGNWGVWTGSSASGSRTGYDCLAWQSDLFASTGQSGSSTFASTRWTSFYDPTPCASEFSLYCFED
jgi:uncharacterized protein YjdB